MTTVNPLDPTAKRRWDPHLPPAWAEASVVIAVVAAAFLVRLWPLPTAHFWDEAVYLQNAEVICCGKHNYSELDSRPPLLSLIFALVFLVSHHVYAASIIVAFLNALGPALLYLGGRRVVGRVPAAIAAFLLAFSPFFVGVFPSGFASADTGNSLLSDSPALTLILLAFWLLVRAREKPASVGYAVAGFVLALTVLMRFASLASVGVLSLLLLDTKRWRQAVVSCAAGFAGGLGPYLVWSRLEFGGFLTTLRNGWQNLGGEGEAPLYYLRNIGNIFGWITVAGLGLWIGRWAWHARREGRDAHPEEYAGFANTRPARPVEGFLWLWALALLLFFSALRHKEPRYVIPVAPPLLLLAGSGLATVLQPRRRAIRAAGGAVLAAALMYTVLPAADRFDAPFFDTEVSEEMQVADCLNHSVPPGTVLYSHFNYPVFAYYTNLPVERLWQRGPGLYAALEHLPADGILIAYRESDSIPGLNLTWLDANAHFRRFREFPSLVLYRYHLASQTQGGTPGLGALRAMIAVVPDGSARQRSPRRATGAVRRPPLPRDRHRYPVGALSCSKGG